MPKNVDEHINVISKANEMFGIIKPTFRLKSAAVERVQRRATQKIVAQFKAEE